MIHIKFLFVIIVVLISARLFSLLSSTLNLEDHPNYRKVHKEPVPIVGGIAMFIGFIFGALILDYEIEDISYILLFSFIIFFIGLVDDIRGVTAIARLFFQIAFSLMLVSYTNIEITSFGNIISENEVLLNGFSIIVTVLAIAGGINALNLMDGIDGLSGTLSLITLLSISLLVYFNNNNNNLIICFLYVSILLPYLYLNLSKNNRIFMGDSGAYFIGFGVLWILIQYSQGADRAYSPVIALWIFAVPLIDIFSVIALRIYKRSSPFKPDHSHVHFQLAKRYRWSNKKILIVLSLIASTFSSIGILGSKFLVLENIMFLGIISLTVVYIIVLFKWNIR